MSSLSRYIITFASSEWKCWEDLLFGQDTLVHLEFFLNLEKSQLLPTQSVGWELHGSVGTFLLSYLWRQLK